MLDITSQDIADLADDHLRDLVGLLCEAQLRNLGLPRSAVTWGGHQDAPDGGLDVRVALPPSASIQGFVPRPAEDPEAVWKMVVAQLAVTQEDKRNVQVLRGFLNALGERNPELSNRLLDDALEDTALATFIPVLQIAVGVDDRGLGRLKRTLTRDTGSIEVFRHLAWGRTLELISGTDFRELVLGIAAKPNGLDVAVEILAMRLHSDEQEQRTHDCEVIEAGRALMRQLSIKKGRQQKVYELGEIVTACLRGQDGASIAQDVCRKLKHAVSKTKPTPSTTPD